MLINTGNISRKVLSKVLRSFVKNFERLHLEIYDLKTKLEEEQGKKQQLLAQINRDYENSSIPSSKKENRKKIANSREKTDKKEASGIMVEA